MSKSIISIGGRVFQSFLSQLTSNLTKPNAKFIRYFLCGVLSSDNLVLTYVAAKVLCSSRLTAIAKRFRRQLANRQSYLEKLWSNYLSLARAQEQNDSIDLFDAFGIRKATTVLKVKLENLGTAEHQTKKAQKSHPKFLKIMT